MERLLPREYELLQVLAQVDWSFIADETANLYSPDVARPAYPAQVLFLAYYADPSGVEVAEQCRYNLLDRASVGLPLGGPTPE